MCDIKKKTPLTTKERNERFKKNHDLTQKYKCDVCFAEYTYFAKSNHLKSKYHLNAMKIRKDTTDILLDLKEAHGETLKETLKDI
jgi:hypothetical protein